MSFASDKYAAADLYPAFRKTPVMHSRDSSVNGRKGVPTARRNIQRINLRLSRFGPTVVAAYLPRCASLMALAMPTLDASTFATLLRDPRVYGCRTGTSHRGGTRASTPLFTFLP